MRLQVNAFIAYVDKLHWICCEDGIPQFSNTNPKKKGGIKRKTCKTELSIRSDNWVSQLRSPLVNILQAIFYFTKDLAHIDIAQFSRMSKKTIWKISRTLRHIAAKFITKHPQTTKIGGKNCFGQEMYVAIDETACGKRKFNRGRRKKTIWTLGGVEMPDKSHQSGQIPRMFAITVPNRSRETLLPILLKMIHQNSVIWSDGWGAYFVLVEFFKTWQWVNHSRTFKDEDTGCCTNRLEGLWTHLKKKIKRGTRKADIEEHVQLYNFHQWSRNPPDFKTLGHY